ncbi:MAG: hypothetical protein RLN90_10310 [Balneolaceae bacterium]
MKKILKIVATNWVHIPGFLVTLYFSLILFKAVGLEETYDWTQVLFLSIFSIPFVFLTFGLPFLAGLFIALSILDVLAFKFTKLSAKLIVQIQWILIIPPFIYWAFRYDYWAWLTLCCSFLVTQLIREKMVNKVITKSETQNSVAL